MSTKWQRVWRTGIAPLASPDGLAALEKALVIDDRRLLQGVTSAPSFLNLPSARPICGACALAWLGWHGDGLRTTSDIERYFHQLCDAVDAALNEAAATRFFLNWYDSTPRDEMRRLLLAEVRLELARRRPLAA
jgi:hypothetical protein